MNSTVNENHITFPSKRKLYELTVKDAQRARLIEIINDPSFVEFEELDNDGGWLSWLAFAGFCLLPFAILAVLGFIFGVGH